MREQFKSYYRWARAWGERPELLPVQRDERMKALAAHCLISRTYNSDVLHLWWLARERVRTQKVYAAVDAMMTAENAVG